MKVCWEQMDSFKTIKSNSHLVIDAIDCGIKKIGCCTSSRWQKLGTTKSFLTVLVLVAIVQGISEKFMWISAQQAALEHDFKYKVVGTK